MLNQAIGKSHAKIILMGEHSVVYGKLALALPISRVNLQVTIQPAKVGQRIQCKYFIGAIQRVPSSMLGLKRLIQRVLNAFRRTQAPFLMKIESTIPSARGMGSSAAVAVATTRALYHYFNHPLTHQKLLRVANIEEKITHGNPSGIDAATASANLPVGFIPGHSIQSIPINLNGALVIADSGIKGRTDIAVNAVHQLVVNQPKVGKGIINNLGKLAIDAKYQLSKNNPIQLGTDMNRAQQCLTKLGVSTGNLDHLIIAARKAGAYGAKLTGSGLGGCVIALTKHSQVNHVAQVLLKAGAVNTWIQPFYKRGDTVK